MKEFLGEGNKKGEIKTWKIRSETWEHAKKELSKYYTDIFLIEIRDIKSYPAGSTPPPLS